jgi:hypothetical protein
MFMRSPLGDARASARQFGNSAIRRFGDSAGNRAIAAGCCARRRNDVRADVERIVAHACMAAPGAMTTRA